MEDGVVTGVREGFSTPWELYINHSIQDMAFEGRTFKGLQYYDEYLRGLYGDYMQLPPKEKQITHHMFKAYWK